MLQIAIIGDFDPTFRPHTATVEALAHAGAFLKVRIVHEWIATDRILTAFSAITSRFQGYWIAPGSPYRSMQGALQIIRHARENKMPALGTCGGFQHMVIEFARHVMHMNDAHHAEYDPYASQLVINPLSCSLKGQHLDIELPDAQSKTRRFYHTVRVTEKYYCNFGLNPEYQQQIHNAGFHIVGTDSQGEARILELDQHPFFIATLFVPQDNSRFDKPHPLVTGFVQAAIAAKKEDLVK